MTGIKIINTCTYATICCIFTGILLRKCGDFFYWFVSSHLKRVEFNPNFPVLEFLVLCLQVHHKAARDRHFSNSLDTWGLFLVHLITMAMETSTWPLFTLLITLKGTVLNTFIFLKIAEGILLINVYCAIIQRRGFVFACQTQLNQAELLIYNMPQSLFVADLILLQWSTIYVQV